MNLKKIIALLLCAAILCTSAFAFTPYLPEESEREEASSSENEDSTSTEENKENTSNQNTVQHHSSTSYYSNLFNQIMDAYVSRHLYNFSKEELMQKFFDDFLADNPQYFKFFTQYLLSTMDDYSGLYDKDSHFLDGVGEGSNSFGIMIFQKEDGVYIRKVVEGSNAQSAGVMAGDKFVSIMGINVEKLPIDAIINILSSHEDYAPKQDAVPAEGMTESTAEGTTGRATEPKAIPCTMVLERKGEKIEFSFEKSTITPSQIDATVIDNNGKPTAYITVASFLGENTDKEFCEKVKQYADEGIKHLTIDLRNNGGGALDYALSMAECFIAKDELICYYNDRNLEVPTPIYSTTDKVSFDSITVLINENTVSAAELMASILKTKGIATIVGTTSYGKSLGQSAYKLPTGDIFTITSYEILDQNKETYNGVGVIPDLMVENVEMCYTLPELLHFNHENYVEIKEGVYSDVTKALEDRLQIMGYLYEQDCDGIFDETTKTALMIFQKARNIDGDGYVNHKTVTEITRQINKFKSYTYFDDSQLDTALIFHHSLSQAKRLIKEREKLNSKQAELIKARNEELDKEDI